jgi:DNA repair protein RecN (Recombination protein N)
LDGCALDLKQLGREEAGFCAGLAELLRSLNPARRAAAERMKAMLESELLELGFAQELRVEFEFSPRELHPGRADCAEEQARIFWRPNPGQPAQPLDKIASGGELSRFLLGLVTLMSRRMEDEPVLIFDEVDSGVGGITLNKVADKLRRLGRERQILLITHWPNLALTASRHFLVHKEVLDGETYTRCRRLSGEEVREEISRMAGGGEHGKFINTDSTL